MIFVLAFFAEGLGIASLFLDEYRLPILTIGAATLLVAIIGFYADDTWFTAQLATLWALYTS